MNFCENCGQPAGTTSFCTACGARLRQDQGSQWDTAETQALETVDQPCPQCGAEVLGLNFCVACGQPVHDRNDLSQPRRRMLIPALIILALVLAAAGTGIAWYVRDNGSPTAGADDGQTRTDPSTGAGTQDDQEPDDDRSEQVRVRCWDGTAVDRRTQCSMPVGAEGLRWIFPTIDTLPTCRTRRLTDRVLIACEASDGSEYNFSSWFDPVALGQHYENNSDSAATEKPASDNLPAHREWTYLTANETLANRYKVAVAYLDQPYSATIYAATFDQRAAKLRELQMREPDELRGVQENG